MKQLTNIKPLKPPTVFFGQLGDEKIILKRAQAQERAALFALHHSGIVAIKAEINIDADEYLVFDHCGKNLYQQQVTPTQAASIVRDVAKTCIYLHVKGAHNDITPGNICIQNKPRLVDFEQYLPTCDQSVQLGTPGFRCSDQLYGKSRPTNDVFGLGATMSYLFSGEPPFLRGDNQQTWRSLDEPVKSRFEDTVLRTTTPYIRCPVQYRALIEKMLKYQPQERPSINEVYNYLSNEV